MRFTSGCYKPGVYRARRQPFLRRIMTRLIGLIPSVVVAIAVGRPGIDTLLVASQVVLSIVLPFVAAPLIWLTSSKPVMSVRKPEQDAATDPASTIEPDPAVVSAVSSLAAFPSPAPPSSMIDDIEEVQLSSGHGLGSLDEKHTEAVAEKHEHRLHDIDPEASSFDEERYVSFASGWIVTSLAYLIFFVILAANMYAIVMLAMGRTS